MSARPRGAPSWPPALTDFATGWSDKRDALIGELRHLSGLAATAVQQCTNTDEALARALPGGDAAANGVTANGAPR